MVNKNPKALAFDVFGTVVDWKSSIIKECGELADRKGIANVDWPKFVAAWREGYGPSMDRVRKGSLPWTNIDSLHRMILDEIIVRFKIINLTEEDKQELNLAWHRLTPWQDAVPGLTRLKAGYIISTLSNGNIALLTNMAKRAGLPWDCVLSAESVKHYKPDPEAYLGAVELLGLEPSEVMMVAAHKPDLKAARNCGLLTAFVPRPLEHGLGQQVDFEPEDWMDLVANDFEELATKLGI